MVAFLLSFLLSIVAFFFKKSKILLSIFFIFMWLLFGFNYSNADLPMYIGFYDVAIPNFIFFKVEGGYSFLMYCCKILGLNFQQFLIVISGLILLLLYRFFYVFSVFPAILAVCFFWIFFPLEYVILRNFLAFAIVLQGLNCVLKNEKQYHLKFIFFVLLASTIHISSIFYLIFLLAFRENVLNIKLILIYVLVLLAIVAISHDLISHIFSFYFKDKVVFYETGLPLFLFYSTLQVINLGLTFYVFKHLDYPKKENDVPINTTLLNLNIVMLFLIVVYYEYAVFVRMLFNISIVNAVFITNILFLNKLNVKLKLAYFGYLFILFLVFILKVKENTILPLFCNNLLF